MSEPLDDPRQRVKTLEAIHDEAVDAIITIDNRGIIASVNPATETLFGFEESELLGQNIKILMPNPYREAHDGYLENYRKSGKRQIIGIGREVVGQRKNGVTFPIHLAVSEIQIGDQTLFAGVIRDLSAFKSLEKATTSLGRIIEDSVNEIFIFDTESLKFVLVNNGGRENLQYTLDELKELTPVDIKPDFTEPKFREAIEPLRSGNVAHLNFETRHQRKDGSVYDVEVHLHTSTHQEKEVYVAFILDVTQRNKAERAIQKQREQMQADLEALVETRTAELRATQAELVQAEKFSTLGKVSGGIAHEIRNPLNAVKTSAYYLLNAKNPSAEKTKEHLERIDRQVTMIDNVVTALSDVAKLPDANLDSVDLGPILRRLVAMVELPENIEPIVDLPEHLPDVQVDENQIVIAFKNLLRNARDAMADRGGKLTISATIEQDAVVFHVNDTGCGISPEDMQKILEPLYTTKARGMGLGLSITRAIVEKNAGELSVASEPGKGSQFSILLGRKDTE
ncbi:MAG: PAS domain S-box protein [Planctomycetota bacterium]